MSLALADVGSITIPGRQSLKHTPAWKTLLAQTPRPEQRYKLTRLAGWCSSRGLGPGQVSDAVMDAFLRHLCTSSLSAEPQRVHRDSAVTWNDCRALPGWPECLLTVPDNRRNFAVPLSDFPTSLGVAIEAWLDRLAGKNPDDPYPIRPLRPASIVTRRKQIHLFVSALVLSGENPAGLTSLADLVRPDRFAKALNHFWEKAGQTPSHHGAQIAGAMMAIARHGVDVPTAQLQKLKAYSRKITPQATGMTQRNRDRLRPLTDVAAQSSFCNLAEVIVSEVRRVGTPTCRLALQIECALMHEFLLMIPIRINNLARLRFGINLIRGINGDIRLVLSEAETKNRTSLDVRLPRSLADLLVLFETKYRPLLNGADSQWLFPGAKPDQPKSQQTLRSRLQTCLRKRCGLVFHPHLYRHAAAYFMLQANPGSHAQVQRVLGHKSLATTLNFYSGAETDHAIQHYDHQIEQLRERKIPARAAGARRSASR